MKFLSSSRIRNILLAEDPPPARSRLQFSHCPEPIFSDFSSREQEEYSCFEIRKDFSSLFSKIACKSSAIIRKACCFTRIRTSSLADYYPPPHPPRPVGALVTARLTDPPVWTRLYTAGFPAIFPPPPSDWGIFSLGGRLAAKVPWVLATTRGVHRQLQNKCKVTFM